MSFSEQFNLGSEMAVITPQALPVNSTSRAVDPPAASNSHTPRADSELQPSTAATGISASSEAWPVIPSVKATVITAPTFQPAPVATSTPASHRSKPGRSALVTAVQEQLLDLASQLTSSEPDVKQLQILSDILVEALRRQGEKNTDSRLMAGNLAAATASQYVRAVSEEESAPVPRNAHCSTSLHLQVSSIETSGRSEPVKSTADAGTSGLLEPKAAVVLHSVGTGDVDNSLALQWQAKVKRDPALVPAADGDGAQFSYRCRRCLYPYTWRRELERHYESHRTVEKMSLCHICGKTFSRADHLNRHALRHDLPEFVCQLCGVAFLRASHLDRHWRNAHSLTGEKSSKPRIVKRLSLTSSPTLVTAVTTPLTSPTARIVHAEESLAPLGPLSPGVKLNGAEQEPKLTLEQLHELQTKADALEQAMHRANTNVPAYLRPSGRDSSFSAANHSMQTPSSHVRKPSVPRKPRARSLSTHPCPTCQRVFTRLDHMRRHQRIHSGERPFKCSLCGKRYSRGDYLREHMLSQHNSTPMRCRVCSGVFSTVTGLRIHECRGGRARTWYLQSCFVDAAGDPIAATVHADDGSEDSFVEVDEEMEPGDDVEGDAEQEESCDEAEDLEDSCADGEEVVNVVLDVTGAMQSVQMA